MVLIDDWKLVNGSGRKQARASSKVTGREKQSSDANSDPSASPPPAIPAVQMEPLKDVVNHESDVAVPPDEAAPVDFGDPAPTEGPAQPAQMVQPSQNVIEGGVFNAAGRDIVYNIGTADLLQDRGSACHL
jgi:hypothetical protein